MDKYLNVEAVELKLKEIKAKYVDCLDFNAGWDAFVATLEVDAGSLENFEKLMDTQNNKKGQITKIFNDLPKKFDYFASLIGKEVDETVENDVRLVLLDKTVLENKIMELELKYVEALGFNFSYETILSYNDAEKDQTNIKSLQDSKKRNDIAVDDIKKKIDLYKSLISLIK